MNAKNSLAAIAAIAAGAAFAATATYTWTASAFLVLAHELKERQ